MEVRADGRADLALRSPVADSARRESDLPSLRVRQPLNPFPELDCVRHLLPVGVIADAERRAREIDVGADRVLVVSGAISRDDYVAVLARHLGIPFEPLDEVARTSCPQSDERMLEAPRAGLLPLQTETGLAVVIALRRHTARRLCMLNRAGDLPAHARLTTDVRLREFVERHCADALGRKAAHELRETRPLQSASQSSVWMQAAGKAALCIALVAMLVAPGVACLMAAIVFSLLFMAWTALRLWSLTVDAARPGRPAIHPHDLSGDTLPDYTIIVALYREASVVARLVASLDALDYPREKMDIKFVVEDDDNETRAAIAALGLDARCHIIVAPAAGPRTKPKALNAALPFAQGEFTVIFDAEDRPESDQLIRALAAFRRGSERLACVQARLTIDNTADSWLTQLFTAEYCSLFDVFLPALAARRLPLPLGGSSNHFKTQSLRDIGGWDPFNVTEDADLGMRLARYGYAATVISSTTYEEAPSQLDAWLRQRTRWFKGWIQTWLVHMRAPRALYRELGSSGFWVFQLVVGGTVLAALMHPLFVVALTYKLIQTGNLALRSDTLEVLQAALGSTTFIAGYIASALLAAVGLSRRGLLRHVTVLMTVPALWALLSLAAWRGLLQFMRDPYRWEKTEHGLARSSRQPQGPFAQAQK